ncbi:MAG: branched-chain amino acid ABC transporter ATP-binding protein/permease [Sphaerobacter sp.]|nr:branched-chain amino acid ABC transporter ATP-binding protein/permease [Sphaerobacter sp.]
MWHEVNRQRALTAAAVVAAVAAPLVIVDPYIHRLMATVALAAVLAVSLNLVLGYGGLLALGHAGFYGIGAYTAALLSLRLGAPFLLTAPAAAVGAALVAWVVARPILSLRGHYFAMAMLAVGEIVVQVAYNWDGVTRGASGLPGVAPPDLFIWTATTHRDNYYLGLALLGLALLAVRRFVGSPLGLGLVAARDDDQGAASVGIGVAQTRTLALALAAGIAGLAGALYAHYITFVSVEPFQLEQTIALLAMVAVGGLGTTWGPVAGAILLTLLPELLRGLAELRMVVYGGLLMLVVWLRPQGLLGAGGLRRGLRVPERWAPAPRTGVPADPAPVAARASTPDGASAAASAAVAASRVAPGDVANRASPRPALLTAPAPSASADAPLLRVEHLTKDFAGLRAVADVSLEVAPGEIVGLIGPNGAGKSTVINLISGAHRPTSGRIWFAGREITHADPSRVARAGLVRTFQHIRLFPSLTVRQNVEAAYQVRLGLSFGAVMTRSRRYREAMEQMRAAVDEALARFGLEGVQHRLAGTLAYGDQRRVELVRALATQPRLLLLDEPAAGMNEAESAELARLLQEIRQHHGLAILLVEHHLDVIMEVCERLIVLDHGTVIATGRPEEVVRHPEVLRAYLGGSP